MKENGFGHEAFNFEPIRNEYFGYFQAKGAGVNLPRLGANPGERQLDGVTVAWVATNPTHRGMFVVGWYRNATVFAEYQPSPKTKSRRLPDGDSARFLIRARDAELLDRHNRTLEIPRATATTRGIGQANVWYPDRDEASSILKHIEAGGRRVSRVRRHVN